MSDLPFYVKQPQIKSYLRSVAVKLGVFWAALLILIVIVCCICLRTVTVISNEGNLELVEIFPESANISANIVENLHGYNNEQRRNKIKEMMMFAWDGYAKYAWGYNELRPVTKSQAYSKAFGGGKHGVTIVDSLDTLHIMSLQGRYENGRNWVASSFDLRQKRGDISVFEVSIRFLGGLLSSYALTKDEMFKAKATEVADILLLAFNTSSGIPYGWINPNITEQDSCDYCESSLAEFGTFHLEFEYLSHITGNKVYYNTVAKIRKFVKKIEKTDGLFPINYKVKTGKATSEFHTIGAMGDSFYEYLLKSWLLTGKTDKEAKKLYDEAMEAVEAKLLYQSHSGLSYFAEMRGSTVQHTMDHLACFIGGLLALQSKHESNSTKKLHILKLAKEIARTCHESYNRTETRLGPERFHFTTELDAETDNLYEQYYILRPEVIETYFYLWRLTKDQKYRDWAWDATMAIERHCRSVVGYSGIANIDRVPAVKDDFQQSFFLAETLKYLYLIFSPDSVLPLNEWVFNTEAHPLPIWLKRN